MHGINDLRISPGSDPVQGMADLIESLAEVLATMTGDQDQLFIAVQEWKLGIEIRAEIVVGMNSFDDAQEGINDRIARDQDVLLRKTFRNEIVA